MGKGITNNLAMHSRVLENKSKSNQKQKQNKKQQVVDGIKRSRQKFVKQAKNDHTSNQSNCTNSLRGGEKETTKNTKLARRKKRKQIQW